MNTYGVPLGFPPVVLVLVAVSASVAEALLLVAPPPLALLVVPGPLVALVLFMPLELVTAFVPGELVALLAWVALVLLPVAGEVVAELDEASEESS